KNPDKALEFSSGAQRTVSSRMPKGEAFKRTSLQKDEPSKGRAFQKEEPSKARAFKRKSLQK
ncbi:MAG: hypothetical protein NXI08_17140, partial [bacterium]|nr:hypothetical protein [bacterium]